MARHLLSGARISSCPRLRRSTTFDELYAEIRANYNGITGQILIAGVLTTMSQAWLRARSHVGELRARAGAARSSSPAARRGGFGTSSKLVSGDRLAVADLSGWRADRYPSCPTTIRYASFPIGAQRSCRRARHPATAR